MKDHLCALFESGAEFMRYWELSRKDPENLEHRKQMLQCMNETYRHANISYGLIDQTIEWCKKSDLAIIQEDWLEAKKLIDVALEDLAKIAANPTIDSKLDCEQGSSDEHESEQGSSDEHESEQVSVSDNEIDSKQGSIDEILSEHSSMNEEMTPREHGAHAARSTITICKLTRIFLNKITNTTASGPLFTLDPEINSKTLELLRQGPTEIAEQLRSLAKFLVDLHQKNRKPLLARNQYSRRLLKIPAYLKSTLLLLSLYHIPLPTTEVIHHSPPQNLFSSWFLSLLSPYHKATDCMLEALFDPQGFNSEDMFFDSEYLVMGSEYSIADSE
ncbi:hypothetical protein PTTG_12669 [Puccinia triticina 1-1 BBBD Race 1]|uniref:Uncharacterized protein n=2 Tax=Puccinia triticina TaxID=208348 RepID=A0A180G4E6_PUCT1|nr:uncharacterized protein PtA15_10A207 [Puccinia triticina]OAV87312.1 hypothetical protein PTTG_12669 [Puccinia triticina 1-1 BBBD Race 1]WAQ88788.1 hypothetical protein PtA15_10A207 [Puccinia triticina]WAR58852.1 hypothetical protein PtB15_10B191 [Puccinia triticina]